MSNNKLHPIYVALDSHQYAKAVKLASALPASNVLGRALLSYAFYKSGQPVNALVTVERLLGWKHQEDDEDSAVDGDIIELLETKPKTIDWTNNANVVPSTPCSTAFCDETTLETIAITLQGMNQVEMVYKLYAWAGHHHVSIRLFTLTKQYSAGLQVLVRSTRNDSILSSMQALALQMSRLSPTYTAWAARTALWQWQLSPADPSDIRLQMLPRLAESLAKKVVASGSNIEDCLLLLEILKAQSKWNDILEVLPTMSILPESKSLELQGTCLQELEKWHEAQQLYMKLVEQQSGQQWAYWKALIQCSLKKERGYEEAASVAQALAKKLAEDRPQRSIALVSCELAQAGLKGGDTTPAELQAAIELYAETFASKASCIYSDLELYLDKFLEVAKSTEIRQLNQWADAMRVTNTQEKGGDDRYKLRSLIFALQVMQKLSARLSTDAEASRPPSWTEIAQSWASFPTTEGVQKENQPSDEILLLAVDRMLQQQQEKPCSTQDYLEAATLLEMGLKQCPYNPYLKLRLVGIYQSLHANDRCWELFRDLGIKHIQVDSCTYFVLPILLEGGLYQQALVIANETLKFHNSTLADTSEFISRALENGTWSKADEFLRFQRTRMNHSLSLLESKGITMDCAPLISETVGLNHGIVGNEDDIDRATRMIEEAHNWTGAPSIVSLTPRALGLVSDNRDLSILPLGMRAPSKEETTQAALRRKFYHGILIRTAIVLAVAKGPKKGKLVRVSDVLFQRCSILSQLLEVNDKSQPACCWMKATHLLAKVIAIVTTGLPKVEEDSIKTREERATVLVKEATKYITANNDLDDVTPGRVGRLIVDHLVSVVAVLKMTAKVFHLFGWGKRKKRESAASLATFAAAMQLSLSQMKVVIKMLSSGESTFQSPPNQLLDDTVWKEVAASVQHSRRATSERLSQILDEFLRELASFEQIQ